ncbi:hypothetical protein H9P43_008032 [Blastocladiella emersonii ATCC 22665]|nr:hypothetical protein H9P43_008032 [Blastocladiella emersonii ATCC 22665]
MGSADEVTASATLKNVLTTFAAYTVSHVIVDGVWRRAMPAHYKSLSRRDRIYLAEKIASSVNALVVSGLAYKSIFVDGDYDADTMHPYPLTAHRAFVHLCGYTMYDLGTMWLQGGDHWSMWAHHTMSLYGTALITYLRNPSFYPLLFGVSEITALANNVVWYLQTLRPASRAMPYVLTARAAAFTFCRVWIGPYALYRAYTNAARDVALGSAPTVWQALWAQWSGKTADVIPLAAVATAFNVLLLTYMNAGWTVAVWKLAIRGWARRRVGSPAGAKKAN